MNIMFMNGVIWKIFPLLFIQLNSISANNVTHIFDICHGEFGNSTQGREYAGNVYQLLSGLCTNSSDVKFSNSTVGEAPNKVYGLFQCREDLSLQVCSECIDVAVKWMNVKCPLYKRAVVWYMECSLRFENSSISLNDSEPDPYYRKISNSSETAPANYTEFNTVLSTTINEVIEDAASSSSHFAIRNASFPSSSQRLYCLAQCSSDRNKSQCAFCLNQALSHTDNAGDFRNITAQSIFLPSCQLMCDTDVFYNSSFLSLPLPSSPLPGSNTPTSPEVKSKGKPLSASYVGAIATSSVIGAILLLSATWFWLFRKKSVEMRSADKLKNSSSQDDMKDIKNNVESLQFDFNTIKAATDNFSEDNKLGRGGFGEVYKGRLGNGQEIAVKRLSEYSEQGTLEFKNEVVLVARLQHRNLVKLLGFCISEKEKILVYEFLPNLSLDRFLYDPLKRASLDWKTRFRIITGIARGLLYLHEDSILKIIHRDLKSSNVLLDEAMNAKIADFGLAKLFRVDQTQGDTKRIVGTYGYMAPEYAIAGQFSVKSDVFSFGVIVLEVVSGQRNNFFRSQQDEEGLLHRAWRLWNEEAVLELVDPSLENNFSVEQIEMCIQIGLLCIQEDAAKRPRMTSVVAALNGQSTTLPVPNTPHFLTTNAVNDEDQQILQDSIVNVYTGTENITEICPR